MNSSKSESRDFRGCGPTSPGQECPGTPGAPGGAAPASRAKPSSWGNFSVQTKSPSRSHPLVSVFSREATWPGLPRTVLQMFGGGYSWPNLFFMCFSLLVFRPFSNTSVRNLELGVWPTWVQVSAVMTSSYGEALSQCPAQGKLSNPHQKSQLPKGKREKILIAFGFWMVIAYP